MSKNSILNAFKVAFKGIVLAWNERNFKFHIGSTIFALFLGFFFHITATEWSLILLCIGVVLAAETFNTAIEKIVDFISPEYHIKAGQIKDLAAAAVLLISIVVAIIGVIIFLPYFF